MLGEVDAIILAGDLTNKGKKRWPRVFDRIRRDALDVGIYAFPGNHDYYGQRLDEEGRLRDLCREHGVEWAQKKEFRIGQSRVLCCTLWTDMELAPGRLHNEQAVRDRMNDYHKIRIMRGGYARIRPSDTVSIHLDHRRWLIEKMAEETDAEDTVVITHHAPHPGVLQTQGDVSAAYASDMSDVIEAGEPDVWMHAHTHGGPMVDVGRTRIQCQSLGYPHEIEDTAEWMRGLVIDFDDRKDVSPAP